MDMEEAERTRRHRLADPDARHEPGDVLWHHELRGRAAAADRRIAQLQQLADLHSRGVLTDAEFAAEKAKILNGT